jgi:hypothetical protein
MSRGCTLLVHSIAVVAHSSAACVISPMPLRTEAEAERETGGAVGVE